MERSLHFLYWADAPSQKLDELLESAARLGIQPRAIGLNTLPPRFHFSLFKQEALYQALLDIPGDDIVCATDGFDVFYQRDQHYIEQTFQAFNADIVFSAERGYSHQYARYLSFYDSQASDSPYRYLNAGSVIGYAAALKTLYKPTRALRWKIWIFRHKALAWTMDKFFAVAKRVRLINTPPRTPTVRSIPPHRYTDQAQMGREVALGRHNLRYALDRDCSLFWCTAFEWDDINSHYRVENPHLVNQHTDNAPAIVHVPWGQKRAIFESIYQRSRDLQSVSKAQRPES